jgi:hypothetical protein
MRRPWAVVVSAHVSLERTKARALASDRRKRVEKVACRAGKPVEPRYRQHVAFFKLAEMFLKGDASPEECGE